MGEATLKREFAARPPAGPLNSITALWRDYMERYVNTGRGDPALPWTLKANNFEEMLYRAVMSRGEDGKKWHHQGRVWDRNLIVYEATLNKPFYRKWIFDTAESGAFWDLYLCCKHAADETPGIGIVTTYDVAARIGAWLGLEPEHLYVHAGVTEGARALGITWSRGTWCVDREQLPEFFRDKNLDIVESFLCGYRSEIERVVALKKRKAKRARRRRR